MANSILTSFNWTIKNFDMCPYMTGQSLCSPEFNIGCYGFQFFLDPKGYNDTKYICAGLKRVNDTGAADVLVSWQMSINEDKKVSKYSYRYKKVFQKVGSWGDISFIERDKLLTSERSTLLPNNTLTLQCAVSSLSVSESGGDDTKLTDNLDAEILSADLSEILKSGIYSDITLAVGENRFKVHKAILQHRCPKLMTQLKRTNQDNVYLLYFIKASVLQTLLEYLYTGVFNLSSMDEETLLAADAYDIPDLRHSLNFPLYRTISATTEVLISQLSFKWIIAEFSKLRVNQEIVYPAFRITPDEWSKMKIILTITQSGSNSIQLTFRKLSSNKVAFIRCKVYICKQECSPLSTVAIKEYEHVFEGEDWIIPLGSDIELGQILFNDALNLFLEISMSQKDASAKIDNVSVEAKTEKPGSEVVKNLSQLQKDLERVYNGVADSTTADVTLTVGDYKYRAHKVFLCARSTVFAKMLADNNLEKDVTFDDIEHTTVLSMLLYIYCGYINVTNVSDAINLYAAADTFELLALRDKCANFIKGSMNEHHVGKILLLADEYHDKSLKKCVYGYIVCNPKKVMESEDGLRVLKSKLDVYPDLVNALLHHMASEEQV